MLTHTHDPVFSLLLTIVGALAGFVVGTGVLTLAVRRTISAFDGEHPRNTWLRAFTVAVCVSSSGTLSKLVVGSDAFILTAVIQLACLAACFRFGYQQSLGVAVAMSIVLQAGLTVLLGTFAGYLASVGKVGGRLLLTLVPVLSGTLAGSGTHGGHRRCRRLGRPLARRGGSPRQSAHA